MRACPSCAEEIQEEAIVCRYCGKSVQQFGEPPAGTRDQNGAPMPAWFGLAATAGAGLTFVGFFLPYAERGEPFVSFDLEGPGGVAYKVAILLFYGGAALLVATVGLFWLSSRSRVLGGAILGGAAVAACSSLALLASYLLFDVAADGPAFGLFLNLAGCGLMLLGGIGATQPWRFGGSSAD